MCIRDRFYIETRIILLHLQHEKEVIIFFVFLESKRHIQGVFFLQLEEGDAGN